MPFNLRTLLRRFMQRQGRSSRKKRPTGINLLLSVLSGKKQRRGRSSRGNIPMIINLLLSELRGKKQRRRW
jgi:hypothetical protein